MTRALLELAQGFLLGGSALVLGRLRLEFRVRLGCLCRKGGWNPECPVHGRGAA